MMVASALWGQSIVTDLTAPGGGLMFARSAMVLAAAVGPQVLWDSLDVERLRAACDPQASADLAVLLITVSQQGPRVWGMTPPLLLLLLYDDDGRAAGGQGSSGSRSHGCSCSSY